MDKYEKPTPYPPIGDYGFIGDCHSSALVSRFGSIDWCCMPRFDSSSCFGRLLDWQKAGFCQISPTDERFAIGRKYIDDTLVLETTFGTKTGEVSLKDCFTMCPGGKYNPRRELIRVVDGIDGEVKIKLDISARFAYGTTKPWIRREGEFIFSATGGSDTLVVHCDKLLEISYLHDFTLETTVQAGERLRLALVYMDPIDLDRDPPVDRDPAEIDEHLDETIAWWRKWSSTVLSTGEMRPGLLRSAIVLKALTYAPSGAIVAAPTTSLPESIGGERNWDYRYSWIRDSTFSLRALADIGCYSEADQFRKFIMRSAAGCGRDLQIMYGITGERRLTEIELNHLEGYCQSKPVRIGNAAYDQLQTDVYGELVDLLWAWHKRGESPDDDYWRFLIDLVNAAIEQSKLPDRGLWEIRGEPQHFVHSKVMCWSAINRAIELAHDCGEKKAPVERWRTACDEIRAQVETRGFDQQHGYFRQAFDLNDVDSALLLLPTTGFVTWLDPRMVATVDRIRKELMRNGLLLRYNYKNFDDGLANNEGAFLACSFWLVECLSRQGRRDEAMEYFNALSGRANDLGLFSEEVDPQTSELLGNFPQGLSHLSYIAAAVALSENSNPKSE